MRSIIIIQLIMVSIHPLLSAQEPKVQPKWSVVNASTISDLPSIGLAGQSATIHDGRLFVLGGSNFPDAMPWEGGQKKYVDQLWIYQMGNELKEIKNPVPVKYPHPIAYATALMYKDEWIVVGGETPDGRTAVVNTMELSRLNEMPWKPLPSLPTPLSNAHAFIIDDQLHIAGGETGPITSASHFVLDLHNRSEGWKKLQDLPYPVSHGVLLQDTHNKSIHLLGGRAKVKDKPSVFYQSTLVFDPSTSRWGKASQLPYPLAAGTGIVLKGGAMFVFGGDQGTIFNQVEECLITASHTSDKDSIQTWNKRKKDLQSGHPGFSREVLEWNTKKLKWEVSERLPFATPVTTQAVCNENYIVIPGGEIRAGVRTPNFYIKKIQTP